MQENKSAAQLRSLEQFAGQYRNTAEGALASLALGYYSYEEDRFPAAKQYLAVARSAAGPLQDYAEFYFALTQIALGEKQEAAILLAAFPSRFADSPLVAQATLRLAQTLLDLQRAQDAVALLEAPPARLAEPDGTALLAQAYRDARQALKAVQAYRKVYYSYPTSYFATDANRQLLAMSKELGDAYPAATLAIRQERADKLYQASQWRDALKEYQALASLATGTAREHAKVRAAACQYQTGSTWPSLTALQKLAPSDTDADAERLYTMAAGYRRLDRQEPMEQQLELLSQKYPQSEWYQKALVLAGNYYLIQKDTDKASGYYQQSYERFPTADTAAMNQWKVAWFAYRDRNFDEAKRLFQEHIARFPSSPQLSAALYWMGRLAEREAPASSVPYYQKLVDAFPNFYYAMLARERLEALPAAAKSVASTSAASTTASALSQIQRKDATPVQPAAFSADGERIRQRAQLLESAWLMDLAIEELRPLLTNDVLGVWAGSEMARLETERGRHHISLRYAKRYVPGYFSRYIGELPPSVWESLFPLPWWDQIKKQASAAHVDPYLVAGLIRQESEFDPQARSRSNARGLMQLLPSTARIMARKVPDAKARRYSLGALYVPDMNLVYGTFYLKQVLDQFQGRPEYALAGYNAGENRVVEWLDDGPYEDIAEFVESIPFTETRDYVQAVLRNAAVYRQLYSGKN